MKFTIFQFVSAALCLFTGHHVEESGSVFFITPRQVFINIDKIALSIPFPRLNSPSSLSLFSYERCPSLLTRTALFQSWFVCLCLIEEPFNKGRDSALQIHLTRADQRGRNTSLDLMQPRRLLGPNFHPVFRDLELLKVNLVCENGRQRQHCASWPFLCHLSCSAQGPSC